MTGEQRDKKHEMSCLNDSICELRQERYSLTVGIAKSQQRINQIDDELDKTIDKLLGLKLEVKEE